MQNCFKKTGFVSSSALAASVEDVVSDAPEDAQQAQREAGEAQLVSDADDLDDLDAAHDAMSVTEELDNSAIIHEVKAKARPEAQSLEEDSDDDLSPLAPIDSATVNEYIAALKDFFFLEGSTRRTRQ
ncbi:hypothetical protein MRX96_008478 [Rhipicephalus microplus]